MFECSELFRLRDEYQRLQTPQQRERQLKIIAGHRRTCIVCNGSYQTAGLKQLHDQAFAGTWGNGER